jgi:hypothetical protein
METIFEIWFRLLVSFSGAIVVFGGILVHVFIQIQRGGGN